MGVNIFQFRCSNEPWFTSGLITSIDKKDELYKLSKKDPSAVQKYKKHSNLLVKLKNKAMIDYDRQKIADYGNDKSKTWRYVNELMKRKRKTQSSIKNIRNPEGEMISDENEVVDCFADYFGSVAKNLATDSNSNENSETLIDPLQYIPSRVQEDFEFCDTTTAEILDVILSQDIKKASGYDDINNKIIKRTSKIVSPFLKTLFNACFS